MKKITYKVVFDYPRDVLTIPIEEIVYAEAMVAKNQLIIKSTKESYLFPLDTIKWCGVNTA